ncbi:MAG TPA: divergent PAP2 family protein [Oscillospiraceae bacterium]|mgnify:CR=1 FL=1|nr:divergent PAP2 family protein [Oscillospiraceae bacterium]
MGYKFEYNYVLLTAVVSWFSAQIIKTIIHLIRYRTFNPERLFGAGGMPSSHSALVCSATLAVSRKIGTNSVEFALMFILAVVVMYDAMGVRRAAGLHAKEINRINKTIEESTNDNKQEEYKELKEYLGHTPFEVLGGALLGILISLIVPVC